MSAAYGHRLDVGGYVSREPSTRAKGVSDRPVGIDCCLVPSCPQAAVLVLHFSPSEPQSRDLVIGAAHTEQLQRAHHIKDQTGNSIKEPLAVAYVCGIQSSEASMIKSQNLLLLHPRMKASNGLHAAPTDVFESATISEANTIVRRRHDVAVSTRAFSARVEKSGAGWREFSSYLQPLLSRDNSLQH